MVDYNSPQSLSSPPGEINKIQILQRRAYYLDAVQEMRKVANRGGAMDLYVVKAALDALFFELQASLKEDFNEGKDKENKYEWLKSIIGESLSSNPDEDYDSINQAFEFMNEWLHKKNLTKFATKKDIPSWDIEARNKDAGV